MFVFEETALNVPGLKKDVELYILSDSHLTLLDGEPTAYEKAAKEFIDGCFYRFPQYRQEDLFDMFFEIARRKADAVALTGDIISFPSEANLRRLREAMESLSVPCLYTPGNHDWNYDYFWAVKEELHRGLTLPDRETAMGPFRAFCQPMHQAIDMEEIRLLAVYNGDHYVSNEQYEWVKRQLADGKKCLLFLHAPLYTPDLARSVYAAQNNYFMQGVPASLYAIGRPEPKKEELDPVNGAFLDLVSGAPNLLAVFAGHIHISSQTNLNDRLVQYTTTAGYAGAGRKVTIKGI